MAERALPWATFAFIALCVLFGGSAVRPGVGFLLIAAAGTALTTVVVARGGLARLAELPFAARLALVLMLAIPALQLVPLPPGLWSSLPGRALPAGTLETFGGGLPWRPLTLSIVGTVAALLCATWLVALTAALLMMDEADVRRALLLLFGLGALHLAVGAVQFMSRGRLLDFHGSSHRGLLLGFLANKNHSGLFLASMIPVGLALAPRGRGKLKGALIWLAPLCLFFLVGIVATYSRASLLLGVAALAAAVLIGRSEGAGSHGKLALGVLGVALGLAALASTGVGADAVARFGLVGNDLRWLFWRGSWPIAVDHFPVGGGIGVFEQAFAAGERLEWVKPTFVNHAHNDYLETLIETGPLGPLALLLLAVACAGAGLAAWRARREQAGRWGLAGLTVVALFAAHSLGDYPLRRMATAALFFFALGLCLRVLPRPVGGPERAAG